MPRRKTKTHPGYEAAFAVRLRGLIDEADIPQSALADHIGVTRQAVSAYSLGSSLPDIDKFEGIADYFDVSTEYLLGRTDIKKADASKQAAAKYLGLSEEAVDAIRGLEHIRFVENPTHPYKLTTKPETPLLGSFIRWLETPEFPQLASDMWQMLRATSIAEENNWFREGQIPTDEEENAMYLLWERGHSVLTVSQQVSFYKQTALSAFERSLDRMIAGVIEVVDEVKHASDVDDSPGAR